MVGEVAEIDIGRSRLVVCTAIFGGRDSLKDPAVVTPGARYVCFTDEPLRSDVWEIVRAPVADGDARRTSRRYKLVPHRFFDADYSVWVDGAVRIDVDVRSMVARYLAQADLAVFEHLMHDCGYAHAEWLIQLGLDSAERIREQVGRYRAEGLPQRIGVLADQVLLRRHTREIERFSELWWEEYRRGSVRDMISLRYGVWRTGIPVSIIEGDVLDAPRFVYLGHRRDRFRSEFHAAEWDRLTVPRAVATFPSDLANTALEYAGIHDDGWLSDTAFVGLADPGVPASLRISVMVPLIDDPAFTTELRLLVDGQEVARHLVGLGDCQLRISGMVGGRRRRVEFRFSDVQQLPGETVPRQVAALLRFVGFEPDAGLVDAEQAASRTRLTQRSSTQPRQRLMQECRRCVAGPNAMARRRVSHHSISRRRLWRCPELVLHRARARSRGRKYP